MAERKVIIISGPTACGKTATSIELAKKFGGEIVNFDSLLFYKELNIGTAKPNKIEQQNIPHHLIDICSIKNPLNASDYSKLALPLIENLLSQNKLVYLVGGSGFYLQALLKGMYESETTPAEISKKSDELYQKEGITPFIEILKKSDPESLRLYHHNDHYRIRRAVEHFWTTGTQFSQKRSQKDEDNKRSSSNIHGWSTLHLYLDIPKDDHREIIKHRTQKMLESGWQKEIEDLLIQGFTGAEKPLQCVGYKELLELKFGVFKNLDECMERINISTHQLAKSQRTWFKKITDRHCFHPIQNKESIFKDIKGFLKDESNKN